MRTRRRQRKWNARKSKHRDLQWANPEKYGEYKWDISDLPRFIYHTTWPDEDLKTALTDIAVLALWALILFLAAYVALLRYDLR